MAHVGVGVSVRGRAKIFSSAGGQHSKGCTIFSKGPSILDEGSFSSVGFGRDNYPRPRGQ